MTAFSTVFRWELRALWRDPACWLALMLAVSAVGFGAFNGIRWVGHLDEVRVAAGDRDAAARGEARALARRIDAKEVRPPFAGRDPRSAFGYGTNLMAHYAVLPAAPLAALSAGQTDLLPSVIPLAPWRHPAMAAAADPENPYRLLIGRFDSAFVVTFLVPLLIIGLTYALIAGERERGTLGLLLAQPVTLRTLLVAKLAPRVVLILGILALMAVLFVLSAPRPSGARLALWLSIALAHSALWFALSAAVLTRRGGSAAHAVTLAAVWLAVTMLVPSAVNLAVKTLAPVPSRVELILAMRSATDAATAERSKLLGAFYEDHPELAPAGGVAAAVNDFVTLRLITDQQVERDLAPVLARYGEQLARQQALVERLQYLSPTLLTQTALAEAAGTGAGRHAWFLAQVLEHHGALRAFFEPRALRKEAFAAWDEVPTFAFREEPIGAVTQRVAPAIAALFAAALVLGLAGWRAAGRSVAVSVGRAT